MNSACLKAHTVALGWLAYAIRFDKRKTGNAVEGGRNDGAVVSSVPFKTISNNTRLKKIKKNTRRGGTARSHLAMACGANVVVCDCRECRVVRQSCGTNIVWCDCLVACVGLSSCTATLVWCESRLGRRDCRVEASIILDTFVRLPSKVSSILQTFTPLPSKATPSGTSTIIKTCVSRKH